MVNTLELLAREGDALDQAQVAARLAAQVAKLPTDTYQRIWLPS